MNSELAPATPSDLVRRAVREFETPLVGYAASITHDFEAARDVVQDTFLKLYTQDDPARFDGPGLKSWLFTVCRNRALDWLRSRKRLVSLDASPVDHFTTHDPSPHDSAADSDETGEIMRFFRRLPDNQAECLRLKFQNDLSYREIAGMTGLSVSNVGFLIHTGLKRLRQLLSHETGGAHEPAIRSTPLCAAPHCS
jgi:RNA polymerase sigma-70 factor (ECF subfamily)